jgi:hypothetical protein
MQRTRPGYVTDVGDIMESPSKCRYFVATLQTGQAEFQKVVCFEESKRAQFVAIRDGRKAIEIDKVYFSPSNTGVDDIKVTRLSRVNSVIHQLGFDYNRPSTSASHEKDLKLKEVKVIDYNMENLVSKPDF